MNANTATYTIANFRRGDVQTGLSAREAAAALLGHDGAEWEIRDEADAGFALWHRQPNAGKPWTKTVIYSIEDDRETAENQIFERVIASGIWERGDMMVAADEDYIAAMAEWDDE